MFAKRASRAFQPWIRERACAWKPSALFQTTVSEGVEAGEDAPARGGWGGAFGENACLVGCPPSPGRRKPHACKERGKVQRTHAGEKLFPCLECGRAFSESSSRARHRRIHRGEWPFACTECTQSWTLAKHLRAHMDERPYACGECGGAFRQSGSLGGGSGGDHANAAGVRKPSVIVWFSCISELRTCQMRRRPVRPGCVVPRACEGPGSVRNLGQVQSSRCCTSCTSPRRVTRKLGMGLGPVLWRCFSVNFKRSHGHPQSSPMCRFPRVPTLW